MKKRIYIAGPISRGDLASNIRQAEAAFFHLLKAGFAPFCPHWSCYSTGPIQTNRGGTGVCYAFATAGGGGGCSHEDWLGVDLAWVACADAVLRLPGESTGADREVQLACDLSIPVFTDIRDLFTYYNVPCPTANAA
jgi:hypothetical protein